MGAGQSSTGAGGIGAGSDTATADYYELLGIEGKASEEESVDNQ